MKNIISCLCACGISQFLHEKRQANIFRKLGGNRIGKVMVLDLMGLPLQYSTESYYPVSQAAHTTCNLIDFPFYQPLLENTHLALSNYTDWLIFTESQGGLKSVRFWIKCHVKSLQKPKDRK